VADTGRYCSCSSMFRPGQGSGRGGTARATEVKVARASPQACLDMFGRLLAHSGWWECSSALEHNHQPLTDS
jgi:hypothetical protein